MTFCTFLQDEDCNCVGKYHEIDQNIVSPDPIIWNFGPCMGHPLNTPAFVLYGADQFKSFAYHCLFADKKSFLSLPMLHVSWTLWEMDCSEEMACLFSHQCGCWTSKAPMNISFIPQLTRIQRLNPQASAGFSPFIMNSLCIASPSNSEKILAFRSCGLSRVLWLHHKRL